MKCCQASIVLLLIAVMFVQNGFSQPAAKKGNDSLSLAAFFKKGHLAVQVRSIGMATFNEAQLKDYGAWGTGLAISYESPSFKGFQLGAGGSFVSNIISSDLVTASPLSGSSSRYEKGLFNITNPSQKGIPRQELLYIRYTHRESKITIGKQSINTPFINPQDGRIRPGFEEGIWMELHELKHLSIQTGWLWKMAPRSTANWYGIGRSIGLYSTGVDETGNRSAYGGNTNSHGIGITGLQYTLPKWNLQLWNYYTENIMNTSFFQADHRIDLKNGRSLAGGLQATLQYSSGNGGNRDELKRYFPKSEKAFVISSRFGYKTKRWETFLNYTRITGDGRFLMPREWGREPFYTFMLRERNEGFGNVHAVVLNTGFQPVGKKWKAEVAAGNFFLPPVTEYRLNKYEMPAYYQLNGLLTYSFSNKLDGLVLQFLIVYKGNSGKTYSEQKYIDNKIDMLHSSLVMTYQF
jgi:hypothetical protein